MKTTIRNILKWIRQSLSIFWNKPYSIQYVEDPVEYPKKGILYIIGTINEPWQVEMICPCGCNDKIVLPVNYSTSPRWGLMISNQNTPTLHPSVWRSKKCKSHFFLRDGKIEWV